MHRTFMMGCLVFLAAGLLLAAPAVAGDEEKLQSRVDQLQEQYEALAANQEKVLEEEIESYLADKGAFSAQGEEKGLEGLSLTGRFTAISQSSLALDPGNISVVAGDVDLDFWMEVTENLDFFVYLTANATDGPGGDIVDESPPFIFGPFDFPTSPNLPNGLPAPTFSGLFDGVGVDGTLPVRRGSITVREAGIQHHIPVGNKKISWEIGLLDPRHRFLQNAFNDDENTQFLNNLFDDNPAISWLSDASGRSTFGIHTWYAFGADEQFVINIGWFNVPGEFWNHGQFYAQFSWKGEVLGREINLRATWLHDRFFPNLLGSTEDSDNGWGFSGDWLATDKIGVFIRVAGNTQDVNVVELDGSIGAVWTGVFNARETDQLGLALGYIKANKNTFIALPSSTETHLELYYKFMLEDGKLQITPSIMYVKDPGGGIGYLDDTLWLFGVRIFVPF